MTAALILSVASAIFAQDATRLSPDSPIEKQIKGGETQVFSVAIVAGMTARIAIEQNGIDVSLTAFRPNGARLLGSESPSGLFGSDSILVIADETGEFRVDVSPADPRSAAGRYTIRLAEVRPTVPNDAEVNAAAEKISKLADETVGFRQSATREGRRRAIANFKEIIELSKIKQDKAWEIVALITTGLISEQLGEIQNALDFYQRGLAKSREIGNRQYEGSALNNLAVGYNAVGEYQAAITYLDQAVSLHRESNNRRAEAISLNNLGMSHLLLGDLTRARGYFEQSIIIRKEIGDQRGEATSVNNVGVVFSRSGEFRKAVEYLQQGLDLRREIGERAGEAISLRNLGTTYYLSGDISRAADYLTLANNLGRELGDRRVESDSHYWLAIIDRDRGEIDRAIVHIESGLRIIEQIRGELVNPELRTAYFSTVQDYYELYTELYAARFGKSGAVADAESAFLTSEKARARGLIELLQEARVDIRKGVDEKLLEREIELQDSLNARFRQRTQILGGKSTPEQRSKINSEINSLTTELDALRVRLRLENPRYGALRGGDSAGIPEIKALLDDETMLLEYKLGAKRSFAWLVTKTSVQLFTLAPRAEIEMIAKDYYGLASSRAKADESRAASLAAELSGKLLGPMAGKLRTKRIAVVADGILQFIPFSALPISGTDSVIADKFEVVVLPSAGVLAEIRRPRELPQARRKRLAVFADAVFDAADPRLLKSKARTNATPLNPDYQRFRRDSDISAALPRLVSSRIEARNISALLPRSEADLFVDFDASREKVTEGELDRYEILHFATHGLVDTSRPEYSSLVLSLFDSAGSRRDGFLRLSHVYNLDLDSELVVLSACQTALGKDVRGEGLVGLTRGFFYAGAKRVVASLWKVDDAATAEFMKRFYQHLISRKVAPAAALRAAQTEMKLIPRFRAPYFWAGFTIQGEWR